MEEFDLCHLAEVVSDFEKLALDRLSMRDICNLAKTGKKYLQLMKNLAQRDRRRFTTFEERLLKAKVEKKVVLELTELTGPGVRRN